MTPALYYLLPSFDKGMKVDGEPADAAILFDPNMWQPSIVGTIEEYIRLRGLTPEARQEQARDLFASFLAMAGAHRERIDGFRLPDVGLDNGDWLGVVGVGATTRVQLEIVQRDGTLGFAFRSSDRQDSWESENEGERRLTGDGTVPFEGAVPLFLNLENLVCLSPDDFGYWGEIGDRLLAKAAGFHGMLPNMNVLHRLIVRHFTGRPDPHGNTWGRPAPGVEVWDPPIEGLTKKH